jgi:hypothetical protein
MSAEMYKEDEVRYTYEDYILWSDSPRYELIDEIGRAHV